MTWIKCSAAVLLFAIGTVCKAEDDFFVCRIEAKLDAARKHEFSGFKVKGVAGIYTALHGVAGAQQIDAIFHDPKTRRVRMRLSKVDVDRDVALLVSDIIGTELPKGGLALGVWPTTERQETELAGKNAKVIGHPLGIDLKPAHTNLTIRGKRAVAPLTELLNSSAREELGPRGSPSTHTPVLSLTGHFLPGHSGAPILDDEGAVIGIGNGGLKEGQVGHGWAIPFHDVQLQSADSPAIQQRLASLPPINLSRSLFLVVDESVRKQSDLKEQIVTTVESQDGSPILALRRWPSRQAEVRREDCIYLSPRTQVVVLSDPEALSVLVEDAQAGRPRTLMPGDYFTKVRTKPDGNQEEVVYVPSLALRRRSGGGKKLVLNNDGSPTLVLKEGIDDPLYAVAAPENHLGLAIVGTEVQLLNGRKAMNPILAFLKVEILTGQLKGKKGWVSQSCIQEVESR